MGLQSALPIRHRFGWPDCGIPINPMLNWWSSVAESIEDCRLETKRGSLLRPQTSAVKPPPAHSFLAANPIERFLLSGNAMVDMLTPFVCSGGVCHLISDVPWVEQATDVVAQFPDVFHTEHFIADIGG